jgi:hypothetical protein
MPAARGIEAADAVEARAVSLAIKPPQIHL